MVNPAAGDGCTMVDDQPIVLPEHGHRMREHTARPHPLAPAPRPYTKECRTQSRTPETHPLSGLKFLRLVTLPKLPTAVPSLRESDAVRITSDEDYVQQLLGESASGHGLPDVPLPVVHLLNVPLPNLPLPEASPDGLVG